MCVYLHKHTFVLQRITHSVVLVLELPPDTDALVKLKHIIQNSNVQT